LDLENQKKGTFKHYMEATVLDMPWHTWGRWNF